MCMPFKLDFQGVWQNHPDPEIKGFTQLYGPLFQTYSPSSGLGVGYMYGAILLLQKVSVIYCIGTTVQKVDVAVPGAAQHSLWMLATVHLVQVLFILTQLPYNERFENIVQLVVSFNQGAFFVVTAMGDKIDDPGTVMNNLNLAAMAVIMASTMMTQLKSFRKMFMRIKKNVTLIYKTTKRMVNDPVEFFCGPSHVKDLRPLTDFVTVESYMRPMGKTPEISLFDADRAVVVREVDALADNTAAEWSAGGATWETIVQCRGETMLQHAVVAAMQAMSKPGSPMALPNEEDGLMKTDATPQEPALHDTYLEDSCILRTSMEFARDFVLMTGLHTGIAHHTKQAVEGLMAACDVLRGGNLSEELREEFIMIVEARLRVVTDCTNRQLQLAASEEDVLYWPPLHHGDVCAWSRAVQAVTAGPVELADVFGNVGQKTGASKAISTVRTRRLSILTLITPPNQ